MRSGSKILVIGIFTFLVLFNFLLFSKDQLNLINYIDPAIGVKDRDSNCVIGPQIPFGSVNPSPDTLNGSNDGYHSKMPIRGFSQLHVSGTGWGKYGQVLVSPQIGISFEEKEHDSPFIDEIAQAHYYACTLTRYGICVELTPTAHAVIYKFTFPKSDEANILLDVTHNLPMDIYPDITGNVSDGRVYVDSQNKNRISGWGEYSGGFAPGNYKVHFVAKFSKPANTYGIWKNGEIVADSDVAAIITPNDRIGGFFNYITTANEVVYMKVGISLKSEKQAEQFLEAEIPNWDFEATKAACAEKWNSELNKIFLEGASEYDKKLFYTAMYHCMMMPRDRTGDNPHWDSNLPYWDDHFAAWDTWRTLFPLMTLIKESMVKDNINSFIDRYKYNGVVKDGFSAGHDMAAQQGGDEVDNIIADAYVKGISGIDWEKAYSILKYDAGKERGGFEGWYEGITELGVVHLPFTKPRGIYRKLGWIPAGAMSCSLTLEFAYNDFCVAQVANGLGKSEDYKKYLTRSRQWETLWNPAAESDGFLGFVSPKTENGTWIPYNIKKRFKSWMEYFYEGSSWTYSYFVPHDLTRIIQLMGGKEKFIERLDHALKNNLIDHANEPSFMAVRSFNYAGCSDRASYWVREILNKFSSVGYPGNDDSGAMSSWYIFSTLGFFPNAGQDVYLINGPKFKKVVIQMENGKQLIVEGINASEENKYVQSCHLNGHPLINSWFRHSDIKNGGKLTFVMGANPSAWDKNGSLPPALSNK